MFGIIPTMTGQATTRTRVGEQLERFDVGERRGRLIDAEHRGRYWWATQLVSGKEVLDAACGTGYGSRILSDAGAARVTGVDVSPDAVEVTAACLGEEGSATVADICDLPFGDESFDLIVSLETIEHVAAGSKAIAEFKRVLRPDGLLLVSSPNPAVYPVGNEHHVHEYGPEELLDLVGEHFPSRAIYWQHAWLASVIGAPEGTVGSLSADDAQRGCDTRAVSALAPNGQTYSLVLAGGGELPPLEDLVTLGDAFEVRWWEEQLTETRRVLAQVTAEKEEIIAQLGQASTALLDANQRLARIPVLEHRLEEAHAQARAIASGIEEIEKSLSWRITAPLRRLKGLGRPGR